MKSTYHPFHLGTPMTFLMSRRPGTLGPVPSDTAANTSSTNHLITPLALNTTYPLKSIRESPSEWAEMYLSYQVESEGRRLP